jgi:DNA-binding response OmpR family regulator
MPGRRKGPDMAARILIADDEYDIRFMLEQLLRLEGFEVRCVGNGRDALEALGREDFDLLMLDLMMPEVDGFGVLEALPPEKLRRMKFVILSAKATDEDIVRGYSVGAAQYVTKPFDNERVVDIVRYLVGNLDDRERAEIERRMRAD